MTRPVPVSYLVNILRDSRARTLELIHGLDTAQLMGPRLDIVNPLLWEIGHLAWFHEVFILRGRYGRAPLRADADSLYDSMKVAHDTRWDLPLPPLAETLAYMERVQEALIARLEGPVASEEDSYLYQLTAFHEDMHTEAFAWTRQTFAHPTPAFATARPGPPADAEAGALAGDAAVAGGTFFLGSRPDDPFVFDNEKWAHPVELAPFGISRAPVTNTEFAAFVGDGGYRRRELWDEEGWRWRERAGAGHPVYWRRAAGGGWEVRLFDRVRPLPPHQPVVHVNWHEASAYCRWAKRRLPTEAEWEAAAAAEPAGGGRALGPGKRRFPWGEAVPGPRHANLDGRWLGCVDVAAHPEGDSPWGARQMIGNVWEWTASNFLPYPGFAPDVYRDYSAPWFGSRKVLRGGAWITRGRMIGNMYRNFFTPERRDIFAGFRTCAP
ncbi:MAG: ergothioneine biosynthesis protein EgtB [Proteobacteria bacterium]|nr:ergothioneine biosynthesis protein EgtB [Pseudomonadota bacterium]